VAQDVKPVEPGSDEADEVRREFGEKVNMTPKQLEAWLDTDESRSVGQKEGDESVGHEMGRHIVGILRTKKADLSGEDIARMKKVNGYIARHLRQRPDHPPEELAEMPWTYSLRNWGHDPLK
jgi:hypothetical protein